MPSWNSTEDNDYQKRNYEAAMKKVNDKVQLIREAIYENDYIFPKELFTGVMFFKGEKITVEDFYEQVKIFKGL